MSPEQSETVQSIPQNPTDAERTRRGDKCAMNVGDTERWASLIGGAVLILLGLKRGSISGMLLALLGGGMAYRGTTGRCMTYQWLGVPDRDADETTHPLHRAIHVRKSVTVQRPPEDVYRFWRDLENLPKVVPHLRTVQVRDEERSHWIEVGPGGKRVQWDARITEDRENERIAWVSLPGADVEHRGEVTFRPAPGGRGTEVKLSMRYRPPMGVLGAALAKITQTAPKDQAEQGLNRMKQILEAGEVATSEKPSWQDQLRRRVTAMRTDGQNPSAAQGEDAVTEGSEESFPASDPPSWTAGRGG